MPAFNRYPVSGGGRFRDSHPHADALMHYQTVRTRAYSWAVLTRWKRYKAFRRSNAVWHYGCWFLTLVAATAVVVAWGYRLGRLGWN